MIYPPSFFLASVLKRFDAESGLNHAENLVVIAISQTESFSLPQNATSENPDFFD